MTTAMLTVPQLLLAILATSTNLRPAYAWHPGSSWATPGIDSRAVQPPKQPADTSALHEAGEMFSVPAFEVAGADVHGPVSAELSAKLVLQPRDQPLVAAGRGLLHGPKKPRKYPECSSCRMIHCTRLNDKNFCSGHCWKKQKGKLKLFRCSSDNVSGASCVSPEGKDTVEDFEGTPPSNLEAFDTAVVSVPAPFLGCANISNRPTGCPTPGTAATLPGGGTAKVLSTRCRAEYYVPDCASPLFPFGVCECVYRSVRNSSRRFALNGRFVGIIIAPCQTTELPAGAGVGGGDGSPSEDDLLVVRNGDLTETWFSNFTEAGEEPGSVYTVTATSHSTDVNATLKIFTAMVSIADNLEEVSEDYDYDPEGVDNDNDYYLEGEYFDDVYGPEEEYES